MVHQILMNCTQRCLKIALARRYDSNLRFELFVTLLQSVQYAILIIQGPLQRGNAICIQLRDCIVDVNDFSDSRLNKFLVYEAKNDSSDCDKRYRRSRNLPVEDEGVPECGVVR